MTATGSTRGPCRRRVLVVEAHHERSLVVRRASGYDRAKLEKEASATGDFFKGLSNFFNQQPPQPTEAEKDAEVQREQARLDAEKALRKFRVSILQGEEEGAPVRRTAPVGILQSRASQCLAIFGATKEQTLMDLLLSMRFNAGQLEERNILIVPALVSVEGGALLELSPRLLGSKLLNKQYVALPEPKGEEDRAAWGELLAREFRDAEAQGVGEQAKAQGLALLVQNTGEIVRRGVGRPNWDAVFEDLGL